MVLPAPEHVTGLLLLPFHRHLSLVKEEINRNHYQENISFRKRVRKARPDYHSASLGYY
jgi:hypothetical protein